MSLNKIGGGRQKDKSKILRINLPRSNQNIKSDIDAELDDGWHIATTTYLGETANQLLIVLTKPKRN
jgi:hypothetical protein